MLGYCVSFKKWLGWLAGEKGTKVGQSPGASEAAGLLGLAVQEGLKDCRTSASATWGSYPWDHNEVKVPMHTEVAPSHSHPLLYGEPPGPRIQHLQWLWGSLWEDTSSMLREPSSEEWRLSGWCLFDILESFSLPTSHLTVYTLVLLWLVLIHQALL